MLNKVVYLCPHKIKMKKFLLIFIYRANKLLCTDPSSYYNGTEGLTGYALKVKCMKLFHKKIFSLQL